MEEGSDLKRALRIAMDNGYFHFVNKILKNVYVNFEALMLK